jgi:hypothetical protein
MVKRVLAIALALSFLGLAIIVPNAPAKRRCPRGFEDVNNICIPKPQHP